jgi:Ca2+-transporting ATPase
MDPYENLTLLGLVGLLDPPREDVKDAISACKDAGVKVVMVTGDQPFTAQKIAQDVELVDDPKPGTINGQDLVTSEKVEDEKMKQLLQNPIFARVEPKQKLDLVSAYQKAGEVVAMTGDGVNDAPALKKADIGVAMGMRGTQVAREAADMILKDDAFSTIVAAIEGGRVIFNNIRKFVLYLLSCNVSEILIVSLASLVNAPLPIRPLQILYLNLVTDVFPALALGVGEGDETLMKRSPHDPGEPMLLPHHWWSIGGYSLLMTMAVLGGFAMSLVWLEMEIQRAVTISFLTLASAQLWHVFNMRNPDSSFLRNEVIRNPFVWGALVICALLLLAAVYLPGLSDLLATVDPQPSGWLIVLGMSLLPWTIGQIIKTLGWVKI